MIYFRERFEKENEGIKKIQETSKKIKVRLCFSDFAGQAHLIGEAISNHHKIL